MLLYRQEKYLSSTTEEVGKWSFFVLALQVFWRAALKSGMYNVYT
jgi:hypothetical protein